MTDVTRQWSLLMRPIGLQIAQDLTRWSNAHSLALAKPVLNTFQVLASQRATLGYPGRYSFSADFYGL
jgi:hypothetical protein